VISSVGVKVGPDDKLNRVGPGRLDFLLIGSDQPSLVWVWIWKTSPKIPNFSIFSLRIKGGSASYLLCVKSMIGLGQGPSPVGLG